ncbi:ribosome maturation factor RimP [Caulobacter sp. 17J65-9]|uniref:ribosome maturation factor RimP n=1 Tax=Caulobacter sp. 17J65-9 TaxID=2709382 RepID=UPI003204BA76
MAASSDASSGGRKARRFFVDQRTAELRAKTAEDRAILELLDPVAESQGLEIVRVRLMGGTQRRRLQIMAERPADHDITIDECTRLSRAVSEVMDAADPIAGEYMLEVSSPGIDRPLTRLKDFEIWEGYEARIELDRLVENRKRFKGTLAGVEGDNVAVDLEGEDETAMVPFAWISEAKLVMTDELMKKGAAERAARLTSQTDEEEDEA